MTWTVGSVPDQSGRTVVVTGANTGLGLEVTSVLVHRGARVVMACRNLAKGAAARERLLDDRSLDPGSLDLRQLDVASLASVREFVAAANIGRRIRHRPAKGHNLLMVGLLAGAAAALAHGLIDMSYALPDLMLVWVFMFSLCTLHKEPQPTFGEIGDSITPAIPVK